MVPGSPVPGFLGEPCLNMESPRFWSRPTEAEPWRWDPEAFSSNKFPRYFYGHSSMTEIGNREDGAQD